MKLKYAYPALIAVSTLAFNSCGKKEKTAGTEGTKEEAVALVESVKEKFKEAVTPAASTEERAAKLGFVKNLPEDTEAVFAFYNGKEIVKEMRGSTFGKFVEKNMADQGMDFDKMANDDPQTAMILSALSEEVFFALGNNAGIQGENALKLVNAITFGQMKMAVKMMATNLKGEDTEPDMVQSEISSMIQGILSDPNAGIDVIEKLNTPPITIGLKISDAEQRDQLAGMINGGLSEILESGEDVPAEKFELEKDGFKLTGVKIIGKKLAAMIDADARAEMSKTLGSEANTDRIIQAIEKKNLIISSAVKDDYLIVSIADAEDDIKFATSADKSVASNGEFKFVDNYLAKKINVLAFGNKEAIGHLLNQKEGSINAYVGGITAGLKDTDAFGDTTDIETLLSHVQKLGGEYYSLYKPETFGSVAYLEEGFKIETHGGSNLPTIDSTKVHQLAALGAKDDVFFYADWTNNPKTVDLALDLMDSFGEAAYTMGKQASKLQVDDPDFEEFAQGFGMFDEKFSKDLRELWGALRGDFAAGVGSENALIIDLSGGLPKVPGIPAPLLEKGKMPRITFAAPVEDRAKLGTSWTRLNGALTNILKNVSEMSGTEIPMQEPLESTSDGQTSWFFTTIPFTTNDFMPNLTVSDQFFFASTSKSLAGSLEAAVKAGGGVERKGAYMEMNFQALNKYLQDWLELVKTNKETLFEEKPSALEDFEANLPMVEEALSALRNFDKLTVHTREEGGESRTSLHFKTK